MIHTVVLKKCDYYVLTAKNKNNMRIPMDATWYTMRFGYMMCNCVTVYSLISTTILL